MKLSVQLKGITLAGISSFAALAIALAGGFIFQHEAAVPAATAATVDRVVPPAGTAANQGYHLFLLNCAHCHGTDARGDEGPDLHGVMKSNQRIATIIQNGIKGEMPKFNAKFNAADTQALIAFIRTLKDE